MFIFAVISFGIGAFQIAESVKRGCSTNEYRCRNNDCIQSFQRCDGKHDCTDNSDEYECSCEANSAGTTGVVDTAQKFECITAPGICVRTRLVCDGIEDCADGSDEKCSGTTLTTDSYSYLFFVIPAVVLLLCLVVVGFCAVAILLYNKEKYGHRRHVTGSAVNSVDIVAASSLVRPTSTPTPTSSTRNCVEGKNLPSLVIDCPPSYSQTTAFSESPPPPYSGHV